jgi:hypothetical protein
MRAKGQNLRGDGLERQSEVMSQPQFNGKILEQY